MFVANRVQKIRSRTATSQWNHTDTKNNPADYISRGLTPNDSAKIKKWVKGPEFLWKQTVVAEDVTSLWIAEDDEEVRTVKVNKTAVEEEWLLAQLETISRWVRMKRVAAWIRRFLHNYRCKINTRQGKYCYRQGQQRSGLAADMKCNKVR